MTSRAAFNALPDRIARRSRPLFLEAFDWAVADTVENLDTEGRLRRMRANGIHPAAEAGYLHGLATCRAARLHAAHLQAVAA